MKCDICAFERQGTLLSARQMRAARAAGFDPFKLGLVPPAAYEVLGGGKDEAFKAWSIVVEGNSTGWNVCAACAQGLQPYVKMDMAAKTAPAAQLCDICVSTEGKVPFGRKLVRSRKADDLIRLVPTDALLALAGASGDGLKAWLRRLEQKAGDYLLCADCGDAVNKLLDIEDKVPVPQGLPRRGPLQEDPVERAEKLARALIQGQRATPAGVPAAPPEDTRTEFEKNPTAVIVACVVFAAFLLVVFVKGCQGR